MEKEAKKAALQAKTDGEVGGLIRKEGDKNGDDDDEDYNEARVSYPARYVELMGRNTGKATANRVSTSNKMTQEAFGSADESDDDHSLPKIQVA